MAMLSRFPDLGTPRTVVVQSDDDVRRNVANKINRHAAEAAAAGARAAEAGKVTKALAPAKNLSVVPEFAGAPWTGTLVPHEILHVLGEALTPVLPTSAFELSRAWAWYRYFWAFEPIEPGNRDLRLSPAAHGLVDHHRTLSAEQLGVGIALELTEWVIRHRHAGEPVDVRWVDADVALDRGSLDGAGALRVATAAGAPRRMRPDYFFMVMNRASGDVAVYALEAKGTHMPSHWIKQMAKGARQVTAARINNKPPTGFIVSTQLSAKRVVVRVLDPAGDDSWSGAAVRHDDEQIAREDPEMGITVVEQPEAFRHRLIRAADATLLSFAGQHRAAADALLHARDPRRDSPPIGDEPLQEEETDVGRVAFFTRIIPLGDRELHVRTGAAASALAASRSEDPDERREAAEQLDAQLSRRRAVAGGESSLSVLRGDDDGRVLESLRPNGTYLRVEIREPSRRGG